MQIKFSKLIKTVGVLLIIHITTACDKSKEAKQAPPPSINVVEVIQKDVPIFNYFVVRFMDKKIYLLMQGLKDF